MTAAAGRPAEPAVPSALLGRLLAEAGLSIERPLFVAEDAGRRGGWVYLVGHRLWHEARAPLVAVCAAATALAEGAGLALRFEALRSERAPEGARPAGDWERTVWPQLAARL